MKADTPWSPTINGRPMESRIAERRRRTSMHGVEVFSGIIGDMNPRHYDEAMAKASPFGGLIVQEGITSGLLNAAVAEDLPCPGTVFLQVDWRFLKAVLVGEEITGLVEVTSIRDDKPTCTLRTEVRNAVGEVCLAGTAVTYTVPLRPAS